MLSENYNIIFWPLNYEYWIKEPKDLTEEFDKDSIFIGRFPDLAGDWSTVLIGNNKPVKIV